MSLVFNLNSGVSPTCEENKCPQWNSNPCNEAKLLNKLSVTQLAELSKLSKAYISQVKNGRRPPSKKLVKALQQLDNSRNKNNGHDINKAIDLFLKTRRDGISPKTITFYKSYLVKGNKEGYAPFGDMSKKYVTAWLNEFNPKMHEKIWDIGFWGVESMLDDLRAKTGLPCNPHTFRRTFACLLRKRGLDTMTIKDLGRWESLEMVQRYTRSITFQDSLKFYKAPLG